MTSKQLLKQHLDNIRRDLNAIKSIIRVREELLAVINTNDYEILIDELTELRYLRVKHDSNNLQSR